MRPISFIFLRKLFLTGALLVLMTTTATSAWAVCPTSETWVNVAYVLDPASCKLAKETRGRLEKPGVESNREVCVLEVNCEASAALNKGIRCPTKRKAYCWADRNNKCPSAAACAQDEKGFKSADTKYVKIIKPLRLLSKKKIAPSTPGAR